MLCLYKVWGNIIFCCQRTSRQDKKRIGQNFNFEWSWCAMCDITDLPSKPHFPCLSVVLLLPCSTKPTLSLCHMSNKKVESLLSIKDSLDILWFLGECIFCVTYVNIGLEYRLFGDGSSPPPHSLSLFLSLLEYMGERCHTCVADAAILIVPCLDSVPCFVSVPMSLWLMVNLVIPSIPLSQVSGPIMPSTLPRRLFLWEAQTVTGTRGSSQCCSSCCPFPGVVGRWTCACWSLHPSWPWPGPGGVACVSHASRRWTTVWSRPPWHCRKTSGQKGRGWGERRGGKGWGGKCLSFKWFWEHSVNNNQEHKTH